MQTTKSDKREKSTSLLSLDGQWRLLPIALVMCGCETLLVGVNLLSSPPDAVFGLPLILVGSANATAGIAIFLFSKK